jgi:hypothetical protein
MSEPNALPPPQPFNPAAVARRGGGCSKPLLLGCAALIVLLGVGMAVFVVKLPTFMAWLFTQWEGQIMTRLPEDATAAEKERLHQAFAAAVTALRSRPFDPAKLKPVQLQMTEILEMGNSRLSREDMLRLTVALENLGGIAPKAEAPPPAPQGQSPPGGSP